MLDLGAGAGLDGFLAATKVGPAGRVIGLKIIAAMLEEVWTNQQKRGLTNVAFRQGEMEASSRCGKTFARRLYSRGSS